MATYPRAWWYHPTLAPAGRLFETPEAQDALGPAWVSSPAQFPPSAPPEPVAAVEQDDAPLVIPPKRGKKGPR